MPFRPGKLSRSRLEGVHPDLVRVVEHAIQITTQDFRVQEGCARVSARPRRLRRQPDHELPSQSRSWMARIPNCRGSAGMIDGIKTAQGGGGDRRRSPIAPQTSGSTKDVAADELSWFAIEVVE